MQISLKHRIIGAIVILALVVVFVPMLFSKHAKEESKTGQTIPTAPAVPTVTQPASMVTPTEPPAIDQDQETMATALPSDTTEENLQQQNPQAFSSDQETNEGLREPKPDMKQEQDLNKQPDLSNETITHEKSIVKEKTNTLAIPKQTHVQHNNLVKNIKQTNHSNKVKLPTVLKKKTKTIKHYQIKKIATVRHRPKAHVVSTSKHRLLKAEKHNKAYVVQLGSFSEPEHANALIHQLRSKGFTAFGYKSKVANQIFTRVYIGPAVQLSKARTMCDKLENIVHIKGIVKAFDATHLE